MKTQFSINMVLLVISSLNHLLCQIREGKEDNTALKKQVETLRRVLCKLLVLNFDTEDEGILLLTQVCLSPSQNGRPELIRA